MKQVESNQSSENLKFLSWNSYISDFSTMSSRFLNATELTGIDNLSNSRTSTPFVPRPRRRLTNRGICSPMVLRVNFKIVYHKKSTNIHDILLHFQTNKNPTQPIPVIDLDAQPTATKRKRQDETITLDDTNEQNSVMVVREISEIKVIREKRCKIIQNDDSIGSRVKSCSRLNASRSRLVNPRVRGLGKSTWTSICFFFKDFDFFVSL